LSEAGAKTCGSDAGQVQSLAKSPGDCPQGKRKEGEGKAGLSTLNVDVICPEITIVSTILVRPGPEKKKKEERK